MQKSFDYDHVVMTTQCAAAGTLAKWVQLVYEASKKNLAEIQRTEKSAASAPAPPTNASSPPVAITAESVTVEVGP